MKAKLKELTSRSNGWGYAKRKLKLEEYIRGVGSTSKGTQNRNRMYGGVRGRKIYDMADGMQAVTMPFTTLWGYDTDADRVGIYVFYVVFFMNNLVVTNKQCIFAAEMLHSVI